MATNRIFVFALPVPGSARSGSRLGSVRLEWKTCSELDYAGFHLWRAEQKNGTYVRITSELIRAAGKVHDCVAYHFRDDTAKARRVYHYRLEALDTEGSSCFYGPVRLE